MINIKTQFGHSILVSNDFIAHDGDAFTLNGHTFVFRNKARQHWYDFLFKKAESGIPVPIGDKPKDTIKNLIIAVHGEVVK